MQNEILALARSEIVAMSAYRSARSENMSGSIWLDANENPWSDTLYNRYPEPQPTLLATAFSNLYAVKNDELIITRGSDEGIDLLVRLFCRAGEDSVMICPPTYGMYKTAANIQGANVVEVPLNKEKNFSLDVNKILNTWNSSIKIIFLCSPNNPTGNRLSVKDILRLCKELQNKTIIVIDEAYIEFAQSDSFAKYLKEYSNLIVLRTLSKAYGLAGIRCGITLANREIIQLLKKIIAPYPISSSIIHTVINQLMDADVKNQIRIISDERNKLFNQLSDLSLCKKVWKSEANFILFETSDAKKVLNICMVNGIVLRNRSQEYGLANCIRVTVGKPCENKLLLEVLNRG